MPAQIRVTHKISLPTAGRSELPLSFSASRTDSYPVHVCRRESTALTHLLLEIAGHRVALLTDDTVAKLHGQQLADQLREHGVNVAMTSFPPGEASKNIQTAFNMLDWLAGTSFARRDVILAMGGGVVIDTVGWVASAYMRGVPYINVPTTLLAHVDAALGGKVAVDHSSAKNLIGAFYHPKAVVSNVGYLSTLDSRHVSAGLAEAIKKGVIGSPELFELIEETVDDVLGGEAPALEAVVRAASAVKAELISADPYEVDLRRPLNFGHTVGHAIETVTGYGPVLHGEAIACGMAVAAEIAADRGLLDPSVQQRLLRLLRRSALPVGLADLMTTVDTAQVVGALGQIRKIRDGQIRFVLPVALGETVIADDVTDREVLAALDAIDSVVGGR